MQDLIDSLCGLTFMPHGQCYLWNSDLIWLHASSDALIAVAYYSIPFTLVYLARKRPDFPFRNLFFLFGAFIIACGATHLMEVWTIWAPHYWLSGLVKALTAAISLLTAFVLIRAVPAALAVPSPEQLRQLNESLEGRVQARTTELSAANASLQREVRQREGAEAEVRRLNAELQQRVTELETLFEAAPNAMIKVGAEGRILLANCRAEALFGCAREELVGRAVETLVPGLLQPAPAIGHPPRPGAPDAARDRFARRRDGAEIPVEIGLNPVRTAGDDYLIASIIDLTERQRAEADRLAVERKLQETQKLESLGVLAGGIAHDFNNLLTGVLGNASLVQADLPPDSDLRPVVEQINASARRAADLCRQMLAYSGRGRFVIEPVDLNEIIAETTHLVSVSIGKTCRLDYALAEMLPAVTADASQLSQIVMNLVINAAEAIGTEPGRITLRTGQANLDAAALAALAHADAARPGPHAYLEVEDDGPGMDAATRERIFEPFFTTKFTGRGLGLASTLGIVRGHHGAIEVQTERGRGTRFRVYLPCAAAAVARSSPSRPPIEAWRARGAVLVVDDEEVVRNVATRILLSAGCEVVPARHGREAVELFQRDPARYAFVLLDLTMPDLDGEATCRRLLGCDPRARIILMSGFSEQETTRRFAGLHLAGFVPKPLERDALVAVVRSVLGPG